MKNIFLFLVILASVLASELDKEIACEEGWEQICNVNSCSCYQFVDGYIRYDVAKQICRGFGGDMVSIHSENENKFIYVFPSDFSRGSWLGLNRMNSSFAWTDGTEFDYANWAEDKPSNGANSSNCVHFVGSSDEGFAAPFEWSDSGCNELRPVICQKPEQAPTTTPPPVEQCPSGYELKCWSSSSTNPGCYCYRLVLSNLRWQDAQSYCRAEGTELVSIHSSEENSYLENITSGYNAWIGITYGDARWTDGTTTVFSDWYSSYYSGYGGYLDDSYSAWQAVDIAVSGPSVYPFVCKVRANY